MKKYRIKINDRKIKIEAQANPTINMRRFSSFPTSCKQSYPQFHDTVSYTHYAQCRLLRNPTHFFTEQDLLLQKEIIGWNGDTGACIEHSGKVEETD